MKKRILWIGAIPLALALIAAAVVWSGGQSDGKLAREALEKLEKLTQEEMASRLADATEIGLDDDGTKIAGSGAKYSGQAVTIRSAGVYRLSGTLSDGQIVVDAHESDTVILALDGVRITNSQSACINVKSGTVLLYTLEGTENTLTDAENYVYASEGADEPDAAVFSKDDLIVGGAGTLTVSGQYNNGIQSKDNLVLTGGTLRVSAAGNAVKGKDSLKVLDCDLTVTAGGDGLQTSKGSIVIANGTFDISSGNDGIQAATALTIGGGSFTIASGGGAENADQVTGQDISAKALKAETKLTVTGGEFTIDAADDAVHSNGNVTVSAGTFNVSTGDDGFHADDDLLVEGGSIEITACYEGLEGTTVTVDDGTVNLTARDDGINASGGTDSADPGGRPQDSFGGDSDSAVVINGGSVAIDASGDGVDSNGTLEVNGGTVYVNGPTDDGNGALDYGTSAKITGGTVIAAGSSGMASSFGGDSSQCSILYNFQDSASGGTTFTLADADGNTVLSYAPAKQFNSLLLSSPDLAQGETYTLIIGDQSEEISLDEISTLIGSGGMGGFSGQTGGGTADGGAGGGPGGGGKSAMQELFSVDGVTLQDDGTVTITPEGAQNLLDAAKEQGITVDATAEAIAAITDRQALMELFGISGGTAPGSASGGRAPSGGREGGQPRPDSSGGETQTQTSAAPSGTTSS